MTDLTIGWTVAQQEKALRTYKRVLGFNMIPCDHRDRLHRLPVLGPERRRASVSMPSGWCALGRDTDPGSPRSTCRA